MKYKDKKEFLDACNTYLKDVISNGYIKELTDIDLKKYDIKQKKDGFYYWSQLFDLSNKVTENIGKEKGGKALREALNKSRNKDKSKEYESFKIIMLINPESSSIQRFLIATLSDKFEENIQIIRTKYGIPKNGFSLNSDKKKYETWDTKMKNKAMRELKDKTHIDYINEHKASGYIFGEKDAYSDNIFTSLGSLKQETYNLFWKYNIKEGFIPHFYIRFGLNNINIIKYINSINDNSPFQVSNRLEIKENENTHIEWANPKKFGIFIDRPVTKDALIAYIKNSKDLKNKLNEYYNFVKQNENLQRDWLVYKYYKLKYSYKDIATTLKEFDFNHLNDPEVKVIIHRLNKRISTFEKVSE
jgi:hypothetical protein